MYINIIRYTVPNSRDQHEKNWRPNFIYYKTPYNMLCLRKAD